MARRAAPKPAVERPATALQALYQAKLASSGLTVADGQALGFTVLPATQVVALNRGFKALAALQLPYYSPVDGTPLSDYPGCPPYYRLRYLEAPTDFGADSHHTRYVQPPGSLPAAYYPRLQADWPALLQDPAPLIITEGELKAAKACQMGFPTIGLGGVYSFRSLKQGVEWLPSLNYVTWPRRHVYLCFDSDLRTNPGVQAAVKQLADRLIERGAYVYLAYLPEVVPGEKTGVDDFLVYHKEAAAARFAELLHQAEPIGLTQVLWEFNTRYVYVRNPGLILHQQTRAKSPVAAFRDHLEAPAMYQQAALNKAGDLTYKRVPAAAAWLSWPYRHEVDRLTYRPGKPQLLAEGPYKRLYNVWPGWGCQPVAGPVDPFLTLVDHLFIGAEPAAKAWFLQWCAYPLQFPGTKMFTSVVVHGRRHGTGKSLVGYTLGRIYGENFVEINQGDLHAAGTGGFNEWAEAKQFVLGDDVTGPNKRQESDHLKKIITQRELRINTKYMPSYVVPDCINYYFTSNHPDSFFLEDDDRRAFIHEVVVPPLSEEFYLEYDLWLDTGGAGAVFHYLLQLDLGTFNPAAPAFATAAKERMIADGQSDLGAWVRQLLTAPDYVLRIGQVPVACDLFTNRELLLFYDPTGRTGVTPNGLGRELRRAGITYVAEGAQLRLADGSQDRYYAVRRAAHWLTQPRGELTRYLNHHKLDPTAVAAARQLATQRSAAEPAPAVKRGKTTRNKKN